MTRISREDWLETGLAQLGREGPAGLRISRLCKRAGVTRGSFYHHFADQKVYSETLLEHWEHSHTLALIDAADAAGEGALERRHRLSALTSKLDMRVEAEIRRWAASDDQARVVLARVDNRRLDYLAELNRMENGMDTQAARDLAAIEYAVFLAYPGLFPKSGEADFRRVGRLLDRLITGLSQS
ncbi:TetR/AcrR family transcriptional regulator [Maricaulis sp.]|uniref:TetR/AcrR family transcriptional regulator n=1 Tax=Maricaulis sp. TaxID=1486257 RepID=UPI001B29513D|nr:TetR/AcrR family transcriptional regulator [Maricaulis sp.]MBO6795701.1 TetR/AcrR family transcriptional regulator [Maricaulis sp.]